MTRRILLHVLYTWLLAQAIHLFLMRLFDLNNIARWGTEDTELAFVVFIFTMPAFLLCLLVMKPIAVLRFSPVIRFSVWLFAALFSVPLTVFLIGLLVGASGKFINLLTLLIPGCLSAMLSILIRYKQFFRLINQTKSHETNLV